ncbi:hypothetical protein NC652_026737 [Populus alba x Populus x berolinensis]|nr:hypothetical protein NC652_026737 [Populus alba x Populus x berolinensis]
MPAEELWTGIITEKEADDAQSKSGFDPKTGIYHSLHQLGENLQIPTRHDLDTTSYVLSQFPHPDHAETKVALVDLATNQQVTYAQLHRSIHALASGLYNGLGVRKSDVVFLLSPNSILYPTICLAVFSIGAILSPANPANTISEILKQIRDSAPEEVPKLVENGMPTLVTTRESNDDSLSVKELIECGGPLELPQVAPAELEAILLGHPQVLDAAVIPVEDEEAGQTPMAYLVLNSQKNKSFNLLLIRLI